MLLLELTMNTQTLFYLHSLRTKIALSEVLRNWKPEIKEPIKCPFCQSEKVNKRMSRKDEKTHICSSCRENFSREMLPGCRCFRPGDLMKCQCCPRYQGILPLLKERISSLQKLNRQELEKLLSDCELSNGHLVKDSISNETGIYTKITASSPIDTSLLDKMLQMMKLESDE